MFSYLNFLCSEVCCNMWTIVLFETDNTVNVVPNFWYSNGICQWPKRNLKTDTKNIIKRRIKPDEVTFNSYKARPLLENIGKYYKPILIICT